MLVNNRYVCTVFIIFCINPQHHSIKSIKWLKVSVNILAIFDGSKGFDSICTEVLCWFCGFCNIRSFLWIINFIGKMVNLYQKIFNPDLTLAKSKSTLKSDSRKIVRQYSSRCGTMKNLLSPKKYYLFFVKRTL